MAFLQALTAVLIVVCAARLPPASRRPGAACGAAPAAALAVLVLACFRARRFPVPVEPVCGHPAGTAVPAARRGGAAGAAGLGRRRGRCGDVPSPDPYRHGATRAGRRGTRVAAAPRRRRAHETIGELGRIRRRHRRLAAPTPETVAGPAHDRCRSSAGGWVAVRLCGVGSAIARAVLGKRRPLAHRPVRDHQPTHHQLASQHVDSGPVALPCLALSCTRAAGAGATPYRQANDADPAHSCRPSASRRRSCHGRTSQPGLRRSVGRCGSGRCARRTPDRRRPRPLCCSGSQLRRGRSWWEPPPCWPR